MTRAAAQDLDQVAVNTIRFLAVDMVETARSGHPGAPMGQAAMAHALWSRRLRFDPADPDWLDRDRFVLSCGHASALLYALLHLAGYDLPLSELRRFRQLGSLTPGHPEHGLTPGVETTTGPLGQGFGNAVGMAIAQRMLAARFNREGFPLFDYRIWALASDGDLMEGISSEAASLAGHLGLGQLKVLYDDNRISIDGPTSITWSEDVAGRFAAHGWHILQVEDGNDLAALEEALGTAAAETQRPTLVMVRTHIGFGSPNKQDTPSAHGAPLGPDEVQLTKEALGWPLEPTFHVPEEARQAFAPARERGAELAREWRRMFEAYRNEYPELAAEIERRSAGDLPADWEADLPTFAPAEGPLATRKASGRVLNALRDTLPELTGGSADLAGSNNTYLEDAGDFSAAQPGGRNLHFGIREHAMAAALNGMALSGMLRPYGGTFLVFSDYMRPSIRLAALMGLPVVYVFTHDSIFVGEDGPTHQPESQLLSLRALPGLTVLRPADAIETAAAWQVALKRRHGPTALALTRQKLPILTADPERIVAGVARGGYVLAEAPGGESRATLVATGSEVALALEAHQALADEGLPVRVVSLPSWDLFDAQDQAYRESVLLPGSRRLAIEAGVTRGWERYVGEGGQVLGIDSFGASAPHSALAQHFGLTVEAVTAAVRALPGV